MNKIQHKVKESLAPYAGRYHLWVAYSGGLDSHVLLDVTARLAGEEGWSLSAIHVNHGLSAKADDWAQHCQEVCTKLGVPMTLVEVDAHPVKGESPEAAAREARYKAIDKELGAGDLLLLAQHQDDQLETLFLQLLRGSGPAGLSAMPVHSQRKHAKQLRPFLHLTRTLLKEYAKAQGLRWVEDDSNLDQSFDRNYLRHSILPLVKQRWPESAKTLARAAGHQANTQGLLESLAQSDAQMLGIEYKDKIQIHLLRELPKERQKNCLRYWLKQNQCLMPSEKVLETLVRQLDKNTGKHEILLSNRVIRKYRDELFLLHKNVNASLEEEDWPEGETLYLPGLDKTLQRATLRQMQVEASEQPLIVKFRQGGERFTIKGRRGTRTLKKFFQEQGIPHWQREQIPLIYYHSKLVAIYGYFACE